MSPSPLASSSASSAWLPAAAWRAWISGLALTLVLVAGLAACAPKGKASASAEPAAYKVAGQTVAYRPPADWQPAHSPIAQLWQGSDGRLVVIGHGGDRGGVGRDPVARARWLLADRAKRSDGRRKVLSVEAVRLDGRPAARVISRDRFGVVESSLYAVVGDELLGLTIFTNTAGAPKAAERLDALAASVDFDSRLAAAPLPTLPVAVPGGPPRERHHRRRERAAHEEALGDLARIVIPSVIFLLFTAFPAFMGAGAGWDMAHILRQDPVRGASWGAYRATGFGIFAATLIVVVVIGWVFGQAPGGSGIMSGAMAGFLLAVVVAFFAIFAGAIGGLFAALGAAIGGKQGRGQACRYAAAAAAIGVLITPWFLKFAFMALDADDHHRHRRRGLFGAQPTALGALARMPEASSRAADRCGFSPGRQPAHRM